MNTHTHFTTRSALTVGNLSYYASSVSNVYVEDLGELFLL
jgi:hypothetical protein